MAIEDAACLGLVFSEKNFTGDIREALEVYEEVRKPRATKVQAASARARENIHERIGKQDASSLQSPDQVLIALQASPTIQTTRFTR